MVDERWQRAESWIGTNFEDSLVMIEIDRGTYVGLNDTAAAVWRAIEQPTTMAEVVAVLRAQYDVPVDRCEAAVRMTLERFREVGLATAG